MSGPITVIITADPVAALLAAAAIEAASAIRAGYEEADALASARAQQGDENRQRHSVAARQGSEALQLAIAQAQVRYDELLEMAEGLGQREALERMRMAPMQAQDLRAQQDYCIQLQTLVAKVETILQAEFARRNTVDSESVGDIQLPEQRQSLAQRLLARIAHLGAVPAPIAALAEELQQLHGSDASQRARMLATELRRAVQLHQESLERARLQQATAAIVGQTLQDLGYQVDGVGHTLFVEGGVAHFRRADWGDYMVRMRVDAHGSSVNFNVVRAVEEGQNERSVLDHLAEDRWCAEFPTLLKALEVRGVQLQVTRRLQAGELPVQMVARERLPQFAQEDAPMTHAKPLTRTLK